MHKGEFMEIVNNALDNLGLTEFRTPHTDLPILPIVEVSSSDPVGASITYKGNKISRTWIWYGEIIELSVHDLAEALDKIAVDLWLQWEHRHLLQKAMLGVYSKIIEILRTHINPSEGEGAEGSKRPRN